MERGGVLRQNLIRLVEERPMLPRRAKNAGDGRQRVGGEAAGRLVPIQTHQPPTDVLANDRPKGVRDVGGGGEVCLSVNDAELQWAERVRHGARWVQVGPEVSAPWRNVDRCPAADRSPR